MHTKINFKAIMGNIFLLIGFFINILVMFRLGFVFFLIFLGTKEISSSIFFIGITLVNFIIGLIPYLLGFLILFFNRSKYNLFKVNMTIVFLIHLIISIAYTYKFAIG